MAARADFAYVQARLQARHGALPDAAAWRALEASRTAVHYLALARSGPFAPWVDGIGDTRDVHRIERSLRARWRGYVDEVARAVPARWQAATRWFAALPELPLIDALLRGAAPAALAADERFAGFALPDAVARAAALRGAGLAPFAAHERDDAASVWRAHWRQLAPQDDPAAPAYRPAELLLPRLRAHDAERAAADDVRAALLKLFRRHAGSAVAVFAHLARVALDLERLRGGLVVRCLLEPGSG
jgi:hypothetical protein